MPQRADIAFLTLPAAHGKSRLHSPEDYIYDLDSLLGLSAGHHLDELRVRATCNGAWAPYYKFMAEVVSIKLCAVKSKVVILVSNPDIGSALNWRNLGTILLTEAAWAGNFKCRSDSYTDHTADWAIAAMESPRFCSSNCEVQNTVHMLALAWIA
jgi:hypothetical protein